MKRNDILQAAEKIVTGHREEEYGTPEDNFRVIAHLWADYLREHAVSPGADLFICAEDVAAMMVLFKVGRLATGAGSADTWVDIAGYAACGGEIATGGANNE